MPHMSGKVPIKLNSKSPPDPHQAPGGGGGEQLPLKGALRFADSERAIERF